MPIKKFLSVAYKKLKRGKESFLEKISGQDKQNLEQFSGAFPEIGEIEEQLESEREDLELRI
ncbi:MAG: hypothetical protein H8Z69_02030 [Nanohaloarchaea archaeon]|nr:hypothetical protein [Candidatus Nanohaloarchaea archaeon]